MHQNLNAGAYLACYCVGTEQFVKPKAPAADPGPEDFGGLARDCFITTTRPRQRTDPLCSRLRHLDTEWRWEYPQVIQEYLTKTMRNNFALFEKYPHYIFNFTGANRYRMMKEYYPSD
jgi:alpha-mannosidase